MSGTVQPSTLVGPLLQSFFTEHMVTHRRASQQTIDSYRDTFRLLLRFVQQTTGKEPSCLRVGDLDAPAILSFLDHIEEQRKNRVQSRNVRLAAIRSFLAGCVARSGQRPHCDQGAGDSGKARRQAAGRLSDSCGGGRHSGRA